MRSVVLEGFGGPEVLIPREGPEPVLPRDGFLVQLDAIGINFAEIVERRGFYRRTQALPYAMGKEASGRIVDRGPEAEGFAIGERVIVIRFEGGCYAERVSATRGQLLPVPEHLDQREAAAFAISFVTAWYAQEELARVRPGESVLIHAAAGATGSAAVKLARARGARPILGTAGGPEKARVVAGCGAHRAVDYRSEDFVEHVREATDGVGVDYCLESIGGDVFDRSLESLAPLGRLVCIGFSSIERDHSERVKRVHPLKLFLRSWGLFGLNVENLDFPSQTDLWARLAAFAGEHELRPLVGAAFPLEDAAGAHAAIEARRTAGKVLLIP